MIQNTHDRSQQQAHRLAIKTQDQRLLTEVIQGAGMSPWEAQVVVDTVHEVYFRELGTGPLRSGQIRYECLRATEGAGKLLKDCALTSVVLSLIHPEDVHIRSDIAKVRRQKLARLAEEAREQGGLLTQEDLAQLLCCDVRTIRRDVLALKQVGIILPTRGQQKDIGPSVTHKGQAVRHWLEGKEPPEVARAIQHSLPSVERYLQHFSRVVFLAGKGFEKLQIAFTIGISYANVNSYLALYQEFRNHAGFAQRLAELKAIGQAYYQGGDEKKAKASRGTESNN